MKIELANICTALDNSTIGSKVIHRETFWLELEGAIRDFKFPENGQALVPMSGTGLVSCGVARRTEVPIVGYHIRQYREGPSLYADRKYAASTEHLACIVYTKAAYLADPDYNPEEVIVGDYVLVAVLASAGPKPPLTAGRFVHNLAGGNNAYKPENGYTIEKAVEEAKAISAYGKEWITVADRMQ